MNDMEQLLDPGIEHTDPDQLQFCLKLSDTKFWYCEPNVYHESLFPGANTSARRLYDKYCGYPEKMLQEAQTDQEVRAFVSDPALWLEGETDAKDFTREEQEELLADYGYEWNFFNSDSSRNQIICENYFEQNATEFRNDI